MALKRVGTTDSAKLRQIHIRSCAEVIRLLATKPSFDDEAKDMTAFLVFNLRGIYETINESVQAWDDRNYWKKAEDMREKWRWSRTAAQDLTQLVLADQWQKIPDFLITLLPRFSEVTIREITRDADWWVGALRALKSGIKQF
ncbi:MAG TPA: hypothetical protein PLO56_06735 [Rhodothermales bacterium]|nr:hypothetical protein [Rhodothermales bacterium]